MGLLQKIFGEKLFDPNKVLVVGLGNPGARYEKTKHNAGREAVLNMQLDEVLSNWSLVKKFEASVSEGNIASKNITLFVPETFMNLSGRSVKSFLKYLAVRPEIIVVHDDIDLPLGKIRLSRGRGAGGHNGVTSIINELGRADFIRIRLGVGRNLESTSEDVLSPVLAEDVADFDKMKNSVGEIIKTILVDGFEKAMNRYN